MSSVIQILFSSFAAILGIVFNGYILFVFVWNRRIQNANRLLLLHLAFINTVFCLVILLYNTSLGASSFAITHIGTSNSFHASVLETVSKSRLCQGHGFLWTLLPLVLMWNICGLSCDRCAAISSPLHYSRLVNTRRASYFICAVWIVGVAFASVPLMGVCPYSFWDARWACTANCIDSRPVKTSYFTYAVAYAIVTVALPVLIILLCNVHMLLISRYHRHTTASAIYEITLKAQATITHQKSPCYLSKFKGKNAFFTIVQVVGSLAVLIVPYHGVLLWEVAKGHACDYVLVSFTTILLTFSPSINAYVYGVKSRMLRQTVKRLLQQHIFKKETDVNIKRRLSEIFSENLQKPPISRRMSAPPDYGRKATQSSNQSSIESDEKILSKINKKSRAPFLRSISLPTNTPTTDTYPYQNKPSNAIEENKKSNISSETTISRSKHSHHPLNRGQSAPEEEIIKYDILEENHLYDKNTSKKDTNRCGRSMSFLRSCSYPSTQEPSFKTLRRKRISAMKRQDAFELEEDVETGQFSMSSCEQSNIASTDICRSEESCQNQAFFQVSQV